MMSRGHSLLAALYGDLLPPATLSCLMGSIAAGLHDLPNPLLLTVLALNGSAIFLLRRRQPPLVILILFFLFFTGFTLTQYRLNAPHDATHIARLVGDTSPMASLSGTLLSYPEFDGSRTRFTLEAETLLFPDHPVEKYRHRQGVHGRVRLTLDGPPSPDYLPGDRLLLRVRLNRVYNYLTPGAFDYKLHMADRGILVRGWIRSALQIVALSDEHVSTARKIRFFPERLRCRIAGFIKSHLEQPAAGLYEALLLGSRSNITPRTLEQFKSCGCMHLLAISGVHMGLLALMLITGFSRLISLFPRLLLHLSGRPLAVACALPPLFLYALIAGFNTPVIRALVMTALFIVAVIIRRERSILHLVAAAALLICLFHPLRLFTISFQLSFVAVLAIAVIYPRLRSYHFQKNGKTTAGLPVAGSSNKGLVSRFIGAGVIGFGVSLTVTIGILPLLLAAFNRFSPIGPLINLLIEPLLCFWALPLGLTAAPLIFIQPDIANFLLHLGGYGLVAADRITAAGAGFSFATLWSVTPTRTEIILYYCLLLLFCFRHRLPRSRPLLLFFSMLLFTTVAANQYLQSTRGKSEIAFLDVGQGAATFIRMEDGTTVLVDGGGPASPRFNVGSALIAPYLWKKRIGRLDHVVVTHADSDHYSGLGFILRRFRPARLWTNGSNAEDPGYIALLDLAHRLGIEVRSPGRGETLVQTGQSRLYCLGNPLRPGNGKMGEGNGSGLSDNDMSLVLKFRHGEFSVLLTGDITSRVERLLVKSSRDLRSTILQASHHGSGTSNTPEFVAQVDPELIVVSAGRGRSHFPHASHVKHWHQQQRNFVVTARDGTITCFADGISHAVRTMGRTLHTP